MAIEFLSKSIRRMPDSHWMIGKFWSCRALLVATRVSLTDDLILIILKIYRR